MAKIRKSGVDYATVRELALTLPGVIDSSTQRGIAFKADGRLLACKAIHRSAEPESLVVRVGAGERDRMIATEPEIYYLTPHYLTSEVVLVRMSGIDREGLRELFDVARQFVTAKPASAPKSPKRKKAPSVFRYL
jgi:hypothetical protein